MKKEVLIQIKGNQKTVEDSDFIELTTVGNLYKKNEHYYLKYEESEATGFEGAVTTLKVEGQDKVTLTRSGSVRSQLIVEKGIRHLCHYDTGYGEMVIGIFGESIRSTLKDTGGRLHFKYTLDVNTGFESENEISILVKQCGS